MNVNGRVQTSRRTIKDGRHFTAQETSEYFKEQCFIAMDVDEALVKNVIDYIGDDNIISTDYPHIDCRWRHALDEFLSIPLSERSRKKILWDNCSRLYGSN
jgi:predicted TIM-barrel fold metal-dependent hydrolase